MFTESIFIISCSGKSDNKATVATAKRSKDKIYIWHKKQF